MLQGVSIKLYLKVIKSRIEIIRSTLLPIQFQVSKIIRQAFHTMYGVCAIRQIDFDYDRSLVGKFDKKCWAYFHKILR